MPLVLQKPVLERINDPLLEEKKVELFVFRDDLIHPVISGNKWRKLKYNLEEFRLSGKKILVTFGGAWSNHIAAVAEAGNAFGIRTIGIIRGEEHTSESNDLLQF